MRRGALKHHLFLSKTIKTVMTSARMYRHALKMAPLPSNRATTRDTLLIVVACAVVAGAFAAPLVWSATTGPDGSVMVISVDTTLTDATTDEITADLRDARNDPDIEAVVLQVNSPGGSVTASEGLFFAVERTAEEMPVVAQVQSTAASGGYYMIAPADEIYVSPGSIVGSIGVRATYADPPTVDGEITTGPDKNGGFTEDEIMRQVDSMQDTFLDSVTTHRSDELTLSETELANAKVYVGTQSVDNGLADSIGDRDIAIDRAATEAGLDNYQVEERSHTVTDALGLLGSANETQTNAVTVETPTYLALYGSLTDYHAVESASSGTVEGSNQTVVAAGGESDER